jgi:hypothetical protein
VTLGLKNGYSTAGLDSRPDRIRAINEREAFNLLI